MFLSQGLLTWTLLLSVLAGSVSSLQTVNGAVSGSVSLTVDLSLPPLENRLAVWTSAVNGTIVTALGNTVVYNSFYQGRCELFPDLTLRLDKLTLADQGDYTLTVTNTAGGPPTTVVRFLIALPFLSSVVLIEEFYLALHLYRLNFSFSDPMSLPDEAQSLALQHSVTSALSQTILQGIHFELVDTPCHISPPLSISLSVTDSALIDVEFSSHLVKGVIELATMSPAGVLSNIFLVEKKGGQMRAVINPHALNT
ncbi:carcinoembryonic antigen-related cell adhesion molecule 2-like [Pelobates cultripes]|uniref:Carcinoembryonic antigen-related cell adhesion molecule 2-like n=1 Tax=Pelobates cultripes TaxID=61616 RepID=A0AAD1WLF6_PELCU|nr:carcinoembryonic antigen-related cell adhesion molecule 2-like [Pelobates cultripes]